MVPLQICPFELGKVEGSISSHFFRVYHLFWGLGSLFMAMVFSHFINKKLESQVTPLLISSCMKEQKCMNRGGEQGRYPITVYLGFCGL